MKAIIIAGGKGARLGSNEIVGPKALRHVCGRPMIDYVLESIGGLIEKCDTVIVVGYMGQKLMDHVGGDYVFVTQPEQLGTGHAVLCAQKALKGYEGLVYVGQGDSPLIKPETVASMMEEMKNSNAAQLVLSAQIPENLPLPPYGRILRESDGTLLEIVEERNATPEQLRVREVNVGPIVLRAPLMWEALESIDNRNAQGEYLLTDVAQKLIEMRQTVTVWSHAAMDEVLGVNTPEELEECERLLKSRNGGF